MVVHASSSAHLLEDFCSWATQDRTPQSHQLSDYTAKRYRRYVEMFTTKHGHPLHATSRDFAAWRETLAGDSAQTINVKISALRVYYQFLIAKGLRKDDPSRSVVMQRVQERTPRFLSRTLIERLFGEVYKRPDLQDQAILEVLYGSGLRREEAGSLRLHNFVERDKLRVIGKGNKERYTIITEPEYRVVRDLCLKQPRDIRTSDLLESVSEDAAFDDLKRRYPDRPIFYNSKGRPLTEMKDPGHLIRSRVAYFAKLLDAEFSPHQFRHSFATHLLSEKIDIYKVSKMLGHTDIRTTTVYLGLEDKVFAEVAAAHPRTHAIPQWAKAA